MKDKHGEMFSGEEMCIYCGYNEADKKCEACANKFCSDCLDDDGLCPFCNGQDSVKTSRM